MSIGGMVLGFAFTFLFTRRVSIEEYSVWVMISKYVGYLIMPSVIYTNWVPRDISRGNNTSRTGLYSSIIFGLVTMPLYALIIFESSKSFNQPLTPLLISILILPLEYLITIQQSIASGYAPQKNGYINFAMKVGQLASGLLLIGSLAMGLTGAVIAVVIGKLMSALLGLYLNRDILKKAKFNKPTLTSWLRSSWLHLMSIAYSLIFTLDVVFVRAFYGSEVPIAYYGLCMSIVSLASFAGVVSTSVYPRIISNSNLDDLKDAIWLVLLLAMPVFFLLLFFAEPACALFGVKYLPMAQALRIFSFSAIIQALSSLLNTAYIGLDQFDRNHLTTKSLYKSTIFKSNLTLLIINGAYLALVSAVSFSGLPADQLILSWGVILLIAYLTQFSVLCFLIKRDFGVSLELASQLKDVIIFSVSAIPIAAISYYWAIPLEINFQTMLLNAFPPVLLSGILYVGMLFALSDKFRSIVRSTIRVLLNSLNSNKS